MVQTYERKTSRENEENVFPAAADVFLSICSHVSDVPLLQGRPRRAPRGPGDRGVSPPLSSSPVGRQQELCPVYGLPQSVSPHQRGVQPEAPRSGSLDDPQADGIGDRAHVHAPGGRCVFRISFFILRFFLLVKSHVQNYPPCRKSRSCSCSWAEVCLFVSTLLLSLFYCTVFVLEKSQAEDLQASRVGDCAHVHAPGRSFVFRSTLLISLFNSTFIFLEKILHLFSSRKVM